MSDIEAGKEQYITFTIADRFYGVSILKTLEIVRSPEITPVPRSPDFLEGILNLRGRIIPVINLRRRFDLSAGAGDESDRCVLVIDNYSKAAGILVDRICGVIRLSEGDISTPPATIKGQDSAFITGVGILAGEMYTLLNEEKVISPKRVYDKVETK